MSSWPPEIEREREREWVLSEVPVATVGGGGATPRKTKYEA